MKTKLYLLLFLLVPFGAKAQLTEEQRFETSKNLDIYNAVFTDIVLNYVDAIDVEQATQANIYSMLHRLDPYTEYIPQEEMSDFTFMTTGEYGGIGSVISMLDEKIIIREPYEGMPAALAGLRPGDQLLEVDDNDVTGKTTSYTSDLLRGQPQSSVKIKYLRPGESKPKTITVERKRIHVDPVTYYGVVGKDIGYISLSTFTTESAQSVKAAFLDLLSNKNIQSLIIDVRDNGGGVVEDCLNMLNLFIPKGKLLLTMKGRTPQSERVYRATQEAVDTEIPIAVLVNESSASASEILAGAIQDYDRGVVVGTRTYGKGSVQSTRPLPYDGKLKLTTAKYYIPSGRSIQIADGAQRDDNGQITEMPDSLTSSFRTEAGREVRDGGGVLPDFVENADRLPTMIYYLEAKQIFFDFVVNWRVKNPKIATPEKFVLTDKVYNEFKDFVRSKDFTYDLGSEKTLESLKKIMEFEGYWETASEEFKALEQLLKPNLDRDLDLYKDNISTYLAYEIMSQYYYQKGRLIYSLRDDAQLDKAVAVLGDRDLYVSTLSAPSSEN